MRSAKFILLLFIVMFPLLLHGGEYSMEDLSLKFHKANDAYQNGKYNEARKLYESMINEGFQNGYILYNIGNCYAREGKKGMSIFYYRLAEKLIPRDADLKVNLEFERSKVVDRVMPGGLGVFARKILFWHYILNVKETIVFLVCASFGFWGIWTVRIFRKIEWLGWVQILFLVLFLFSSGSFVLKQWFPEHFGVVKAEEAKVFSGTGKDSTVLFMLHEGVEFQIMDSDESKKWIKIELPDGKRGWMGKDDAVISNNEVALHRSQ